MAGVDSSRYPRLAAYVEELPHGLSSYEECRAKGSLVTSLLEGHELGPLDGLPPELVAVVEEPPRPNAWLPATLSDALFYLVVDRVYPSAEEMLAWTRQRTKAVASNPMYRTLMMLPGPRNLIRIATKVHALFQRGTVLSARLSAGRAELLLRHPPHLHGGFNHLSNVAMFETLVELSGGGDVKCQMLESVPVQARYEVTWR